MPDVPLRGPIPSAETLTLVRWPAAAAAGLPDRDNRQQRSAASGNATNYACDQPAAGLTPFAFPPDAGGRLHNGPLRETSDLGARARTQRAVAGDLRAQGGPVHASAFRRVAASGGRKCLAQRPVEARRPDGTLLLMTQSATVGTVRLSGASFFRLRNTGGGARRFSDLPKAERWESIRRVAGISSRLDACRPEAAAADAPTMARCRSSPAREIRAGKTAANGGSVACGARERGHLAEEISAVGGS